MSPEDPAAGPDQPPAPRRGLGSVIRIALALLGFMLALLAIAFDDHRLGWAGILLLAGSLVLRLVQQRRRSV
jgi:hypothetical protein